MKHFFLLPGSKRSIEMDPDQKPAPPGDLQEPLYPFEHDTNTMDGAEFLDDNLRMKDQPLESRNEENK